jgi:hypothetical protein
VKTTFTQADVESLSEKIAELDLTDVEKALLSTLVQLGSARLRHKLAQQPADRGYAAVSHPQLPTLRDGILNAFEPEVPRPRLPFGIRGRP